MLCYVMFMLFLYSISDQLLDYAGFSWLLLIVVSPVIMPRRKKSRFVSSPRAIGRPKPMSSPLRFKKMIVEKRKRYKREILESMQAKN